MIGLSNSTLSPVLPRTNKFTRGGRFTSPPRDPIDLRCPSFVNANHLSKTNKATMDHLSVKLGEVNSVKARAIEDARQRQISIIESARRAGKDPPKYVLMELIGKGSFGRVYKG